MLPVIEAIERFCKEHNINHRFVGGVSYAGLVNKRTTFDIDPNNRTVTLKNHNKLDVKRPDGTIKDIDLIVFTPSKEKLKLLKQFVKQLKREQEKEGPFPFVSVEAAIYPSMGKVQTMFQFVTSIEVDKNTEFGGGNISLVFDTLKQPISWKSLEDWKIILEDGHSFTVRHPYADYLAYHFRMPSGLKPKDEEKVKVIRPLVDKVIRLGKRMGVDYEGNEYYGSWARYIQNLTVAGGWIRLKAAATNLYWRTIGTDIAHGKGPLNRFFLNFSNKFTGVDQ